MHTSTEAQFLTPYSLIQNQIKHILYVLNRTNRYQPPKYAFFHHDPLIPEKSTKKPKNCAMLKKVRKIIPGSAPLSRSVPKVNGVFQITSTVLMLNSFYLQVQHEVWVQHLSL